MPAVQIHEFEPVDAKGAHVIAAFPCVGLVATIAANYLIEEMDLKEVGVVDGPTFPTICVVEDGEPKNPVRIYAGTYDTEAKKGRKLVVFLSEFQPNPDLVRPVAEAIMGWCQEKGADLVVSPEGLLVEGEGAEDDVVEVYAVGSTENARRLLQNAVAPTFKDGIVAGVTGILLNMGRRDRFDVIGILAEAQKEYPDARSAATVIELLGDMVEAELDVSRLRDEAEDFEKHIATVAKRAKANERTASKAQEFMFG